jgi:hypothetical protein
MDRLLLMSVGRRPALSFGDSQEKTLRETPALGYTDSA